MEQVEGGCSNVRPVASRCGGLLRERPGAHRAAATRLAHRAVLGRDDDRLGGVEDLATLEPLAFGRREVLPTRLAVGWQVIDDHIGHRTHREVLPRSPRLLAPPPFDFVLRFAFSAARRSDRVLVASACCLGLSLDGARDEFLEPWFNRCSSSVTLRVRSSICLACFAFSARNASFSVPRRRSRSASDTDEIPARPSRLRGIARSGPRFSPQPAGGECLHHITAYPLSAGVRFVSIRTSGFERPGPTAGAASARMPRGLQGELARSELPRIPHGNATNRERNRTGLNGEWSRPFPLTHYVDVGRTESLWDICVGDQIRSTLTKPSARAQGSWSNGPTIAAIRRTAAVTESP